MQNTFFIYGALSFPATQHALLGKEIKGKTATLNGYEAVRFIQDDHLSASPVLKEEEEAEVEGLFTSSLSSKDLERIKQYAGNNYMLKDVFVLVDGEIEEATTFMPVKSELEFGPAWDKETFEFKLLHEYVDSLSTSI